MRKLWILTILITFALAGCGGNPGGFIEDNSIETEITTTADATVTDEVTTTTTAKPTTAATTAITRKLAVKVQSVTTTKAEVITTKMEDKTIALNIETQRGDGTLTFTGITLSFKRDTAIFSYETSDKKAVMPIENTTKCVGKSGKTYEADGFGGTGSKGQVWFPSITDFADLSTVTLTYAFEGFDPVTVTFDIPGI